jgi:hypothetical protein
MVAPRLIALNKLGEIRNQDPTLYQVIQELQQEVNRYILDQASQPGQPSVSATKFKARAYQGTFQTIANNTFTKITLDTVDYDPNGNFDATTNYRWTCPAAGYYAVSGAVKTNAVAGSTVVYIEKNGAGVVDTYTPSGGQGGWSQAADVLLLAAGDFLELWIFQDSGGPANTVTGSPLTRLAVHFLSQP